jgi:hypothetical protein
MILNVDENSDFQSTFEVLNDDLTQVDLSEYDARIITSHEPWNKSLNIVDNKIMFDLFAKETLGIIKTVFNFNIEIFNDDSTLSIAEGSIIINKRVSP